MSVDIKQNVSPLKQRQSSRGGKAAGRATATSTSANINEITRWVAPAGTTYWILCATDGKVYRATSLGSLTEIFDSTGTRVRISNYGSMLRLAGGTGYESKVYQYIDRDFFYFPFVFENLFFFK